MGKYSQNLRAAVRLALNIEETYRESRRLLTEGQTERARDLGHQLLRERFSGAYEILAESFYLEGRLDRAMTVLERAVQEAPQVWLLWLQLGNYRSEAGLGEQALEAYAQSERCPSADIPQIWLNQALALRQMGNPERALGLLQKVQQQSQDRQLSLVALRHRLKLLSRKGRVTEALLELGEAQLHDRDNAEILTDLALVCQENGEKDTALNLARQALGLRRAGKAARVLRLLEGDTSERLSLFEITLAGLTRVDDKKHNFRKVSRVYALSEEEATQLAISFEPLDLQDSLRPLEVKVLESRSKERRKGVDWSSDPQEMKQ